MPSIVNGTELSAQEFQDALLLHYSINLPNLPTKFDWCDMKFTLQQALSCKKGGPIIAWHNEIWDKLMHPSGKAMQSSAIREEPLIHIRSSCSSTPDANSLALNDEECGDILLHGFWHWGMDCTVDVHVIDISIKFYLKRDPLKVLDSQEKEKKRKYLDSCLEQCQNFTPFIVSTTGRVYKEAHSFIQCLSAKLAGKWQKTYSTVCGYANARVSLAIIHATHLGLHGSRIPAHQISHRQPQWEDRAGLGAFTS